MGKNEKLLERFLTIPADFTWEELVKLLAHLGYVELKKGKTSGSRRKFIDSEKNMILLHEPHPARIVKKYAIKEVLAHLKEKGKVND